MFQFSGKTTDGTFGEGSLLKAVEVGGKKKSIILKMFLIDGDCQIRTAKRNWAPPPSPSTRTDSSSSRSAKYKRYLSYCTACKINLRTRLPHTNKYFDRIFSKIHRT